MENWNSQETEEWLYQIGLDEKYASVCVKQAISGRALLLLASKSVDQLASVFQLKRGPRSILMDNLQPHLDGFDKNVPHTARISFQMLNAWSVDELCNWLQELSIPEESLSEVQEEEINGKAFLVLRKSGELEECLKLKAGSWVVLEHELMLHLQNSNDRESGTNTTLATPEKPHVVPRRIWNNAKKQMDGSQELQLEDHSSVKAEITSAVAASKKPYVAPKRDWNTAKSEKMEQNQELKREDDMTTEISFEENAKIAMSTKKMDEIKEPQVGNDTSTNDIFGANLKVFPSTKQTVATKEPCASEDTSGNILETDHKGAFSTKQTGEVKEPLAASDLSTKNVRESKSKGALSTSEKLLLLQNALKLDIEASTNSEDLEECFVRSIFAKRGGGANALERLFNFVVITKEEMTMDKRRTLWSRIIEKTSDWITLLRKDDQRSFQWDSGCDSFVYLPTTERVSLRADKNVGQIFLEKLSANELKQSVFVLLVDKQLIKEKETYSYLFFLEKKSRFSFKVRLNAKESGYHASFDPNSRGQNLTWSKHFRGCKTNASFKSVVSTTPQFDQEPLPAPDFPQYQTPRPFASDFENNYYNEGYILPFWENGSQDLIKPAHEFKLLRTGAYSSEKDSMVKFVFETLRFACGCLNKRTNGTIHFGVADEMEGQTCGYQTREIVGTLVIVKPRYKDKLTEFINKCFVGDSKSNVHNCIRDPVFIPVKCDAGRPSTNRVVIEVDIEPRYSFCEGETFKAGFKSLGKDKEEPLAYVRHGSQTEAIVELEKMEEYIKLRPRLDEERKRREQEQGVLEKPNDIKHLHAKLKRLLCANKSVLDCSVYPILVLSKPDAKMTQEYLKETFSFIKNIKWQVIIDFDDQGSAKKGLCEVYKGSLDSWNCDIHEAEDYDESEDAIESIDFKTHWIFGNGYAELGKEALGFKQWNNSKRKRGLSFVIQSLAKRIPKLRPVVVFMLLSREYEPMADTFKDFCTYFDGPNHLVYAAESSDIVVNWVGKLSSTCLEEHELRERGVVGMAWSEFKESMQQMVGGIDRQQRYVTMATGTPFPLDNVTFNTISILSAKECEELRDLSSPERLTISSKVGLDFYRGYPVTWMNFWFTEEGKNHVLRRKNFTDLKALIEKMYRRGPEGKVQTVTIYHQIGAGASTMCRQALWEFRCNSNFPYRCAVITKIDDSTCKEILRLRKVGYSDESVGSLPPVLALVEDTEDFLFRELRSQVVEHANKLPRTEWPVCVFLFCKPTQQPYKCHDKEKDTSVYLEQQLSPEEVDWFKDKYTEMKGHYNDPQHDFETYANENLISFMIMKENFNRVYVSSIVERNLCHVTKDELTLLQYTSLLNIYNPYPVFTCCFDNIMLSASFLRKKFFRDWVEDLTHSARIFLREMDCSTHLGTGKAIAVVHPIIASELLDQIAVKRETTVSQIALDLLESPLLEQEEKSFTSTHLYDAANRMLKHRKKYEYGDDIQTKFSPLIEKILYVKETEDGQKKPTEESIDQATKVLIEGLDKFRDPMLAQQLARVFYLNAAAFSESTVDSCFHKALEFCDTAIKMSPNNSFLFDTKGRIYESKIKVLYGSVRKGNRLIDIPSATQVLPLAFDAMKWFQKSIAASVEYQNNYGFHGELSVMFYLLDVLRCVTIFREKEGQKKLQAYLAFCQVIPDEVQAAWKEYHESIRQLRNRFSHCIEGLAEDFAIYKRNRIEERGLPNQIAIFKKQYHSYFGEGDVKWNNEIPEERWEYRWHKINQYLTGDIFSSVFSIHWAKTKEDSKTPKETLQLLKRLAIENYREPVQSMRYKDMLLIISSSMALHSPYGSNSNLKPKQLVEEYREIYSFVEKLFTLEECNEGSLRLYAHLFKVMFLWPRKDLPTELSSYGVQDFYDAKKSLKERWERKCQGHFDLDKMHKQKVYKYMSFKKDTRQYTTLFYLGKGSGLDVFVHINELTEKGSLDWEGPKVKQRLRRLTGIVESRNIIKMKNPLDSSRTIDIYFSTFRQGGFSKEEVSFYLGFSWPQPIALDVKYIHSEHAKCSEESIGQVLGDQYKFVVPVPKYNVVTYEEYTSSMNKLTRKLTDIEALKKKMENGQELEENQVPTRLSNFLDLLKQFASFVKACEVLTSFCLV